MGKKLFSPEKKKIEKTLKSKEKEEYLEKDKSKNKRQGIFSNLSNKMLGGSKGKSSQNTIPIHQIYDDGTFEIEEGFFSKSILFTDVNYQTARQDDRESMFSHFCETINFFDSLTEVKITINNKKRDKSEFEKETLLQYKDDDFDKLRKEYNLMLKESGLEGKNDTVKEKYITFTVPAKDFADSRTKLLRVENEIQTNLKRLGCEVVSMGTKQRLSVLHEFYKDDANAKLIFRKENKLRQTSYKDLIAPDSFEFKKDYFMMGDKYARVMYLKEIPSFMKDTIISELTDFSFDMMTSISLKSIDQEKALKIINKQIRGMESDRIKYEKRSTKSGYFNPFIPNDLKFAESEAQDLLEAVMNHNQKMFLTNLTMVHTADSKEQLDTDSQEIYNVGQKFLLQIGKLSLQQEDAMATVLPIGHNKLQIQRLLLTDEAGLLIPFTSQELSDENGIFYGVNSVSRNLITYNRKGLDNASGFILGKPGSGKSFSAKREMIDVLLRTDDDVIYIDPEREGLELAKLFGGEIINISGSSKNHINPFDLNMDYADDENPINLKSDFVLSLCNLIIGGKIGLDAVEESILDKCITRVYEKYLRTQDPKDMPTLLDFNQMVREYDDPIAKTLAIRLDLYTTGNLGVFSNQTNVDVNNRFIVYDIKDLGKKLKTMGLLIVLDQVWNRITINREKGKRTWIYIDEIYLLFSHEYSANFLFELYKRARKWGAIPTGITQNVEDMMKSDTAKTMVSNSQFVMMLSQGKEDKDQLAKLLNISDNQLEYVTNSQTGHGLLYCDGSIIPFMSNFPKETSLYKAMTTKVEEVAMYDKERKK